MLKKAVLICLLTMLAAGCCHIERNRHTAYVRHHITFITETISVNKPHSSPHLRPGMRLGFSLFRRPPSPLPHTLIKIFHHRGEQIFNHTAFAGFDFGGYAHTGL